jgi:hypothetical protein
VLAGELGEEARGENVVLDRLAGVRLHHRHVLVRRGVEDDLGRVGRQERAHARLVADVRDERDDLRLGAGPPQVGVDVEERELGALDEKDLARLEPRDLARELGADRAAGARDHDALSGEELPDLRLVQVDGLAAEEVFDLDVADARDAHLALQHVVEARDDADGDLDLPAEADQVEDLLPRDLRDRDDDLRDAELLDQARQVLGRAEHADPVDDGALLLRVVVHEALHVHVHVAAARDLARGENARRPGADQQRRDPLALGRLGGVGGALALLVDVAADDPQAEHAAEGEDRPHQDDRERDAPGRVAVRQRQAEDGERERDQTAAYKNALTSAMPT